MEKKSFGKYWISGLLMLATVGILSWLISYLNILNYSSLSSSGQLLIWVLGIIFIVFVPWIYGHILKLIYEHFNLDNY
ncbi:MAG: hypothetical protein ABFD07_10780 [Methanobacterium sp.]